MERKLSNANTNNFLLTINELPGVSFKCVQATTPGISITSSEMQTFNEIVNLPSSTLRYDPFTCTFIVDEDLANWIEAFKWVSKARCVESASELMTEFTLVIPNAHGKRGIAFRFTGGFPSTLSPIDLDSRAGSNLMVASMQLGYSGVEIDAT